MAPAVNLPTASLCDRYSRWEFPSAARTFSHPISQDFPPGLRSAPIKMDGSRARKEIDFLIAMNAETAREDVMDLDPNRVVVYEETLRLNQLRKDLHVLPCSVCQTCHGNHPGFAAAKAARQHDLCRRRGRIDGDRSGRNGNCADQAVQGQSQGRRAEQDRRWKRAGSSRRKISIATRFPYPLPPDECHEGQDHHRRKFRGGAGLHVCGHHRRDVVSDYSVIESVRNAGRLHERISHREGRQSHLRHRPGGRRTGRRRHGDWRGLGRRTVDDLHCRTGHFADERIHRTGLLRRNSGRDFRHHARRTQHGTADADAAVGYSRRLSTARMAIPSTSCCCRPAFRNASTWPSTLSI